MTFMHCLVTETVFKLLNYDQINIFLSKILCRLMALLTASMRRQDDFPVRYYTGRDIKNTYQDPPADTRREKAAYCLGRAHSRDASNMNVHT